MTESQDTLKNNKVHIVFHPGEQVILFVTETAEAAEYAKEHCTFQGHKEIYGPYNTLSLTDLQEEVFEDTNTDNS